jgi:PKD repeat protein
VRAVPAGGHRAQYEQRPKAKGRIMNAGTRDVSTPRRLEAVIAPVLFEIGRGSRIRLLLRQIFVLLAAASLVVTLGAGVARAEPAPPPITTPLPASTMQPPAEAIVDWVGPVTPCSGWSLQSAYGSTWPTGSTWWEYTCRAGGMTDPEADVRTDYYYWDGAQATSVYYGQRLLTWEWYYGSGFCLYWWDQATNQWYGPYGCAESTTPPTASFTVSCSGLSCDFDASASTDSDGTIQGYSWDFGDGTIFAGDTSTATHTYPAGGTYTVQLEVLDDFGAFDTDTQAVTVVASPNAPPTAGFTVICSGLSCNFDGAGSTDSDGTITAYAWNFGDGSSGNGVTAPHAYPELGSYTVTLTVTDSAGAAATFARSVSLVGLTARGYKVKGVEKVDLAWSKSGAASFDVYRNGAKIATVTAFAYSDTTGKTGPGSYTYQICQATLAMCSNQVTVTF